jgi:hypothetical protein
MASAAADSHAWMASADSHAWMASVQW